MAARFHFTINVKKKYPFCLFVIAEFQRQSLFNIIWGNTVHNAFGKAFILM